MTTFLIFIALMAGFYIIRNLIRQNEYKSMHNDVMDEIRKENPNYDKELLEPTNKLATFEKRKQLYFEGMKHKDYEIGFGWKMSLEDEYWENTKKELDIIE